MVKPFLKIKNKSNIIICIFRIQTNIHKIFVDLIIIIIHVFIMVIFFRLHLKKNVIQIKKIFRC